MLICLAFAGISQNTIDDPFLNKVSFRGAFGSNKDWTEGWANWDPQISIYATPTVIVEGELTASATWTSTNIYLII